jgi:Zn-dependent peptidase ImmA (M78 family)
MAKITKWESRLWSYLSKGDGVNCPLYDSCPLRQKGADCLSSEIGKECINKIYRLIDNDEIDLTDDELAAIKLPRCRKSGNIFNLVDKLACKYRSRSWNNRLPVPDDLISLAEDNLPIEVRHVPLKIYHGAIWRLSDVWVIQLNSHDTPARQRFTLYHEVFHILAHCKATPVFHKASSGGQGSFNELLADHFAMIMLVPEKWLKERWKKVKDVNQMAAMFDVPKIIMWAALYHMRFI